MATKKVETVKAVEVIDAGLTEAEVIEATAEIKAEAKPKAEKVVRMTAIANIKYGDQILKAGDEFTAKADDAEAIAQFAVVVKK